MFYVRIGWNPTNTILIKLFENNEHYDFNKRQAEEEEK